MIHKLEPIWWLLFGAGGFVAAVALPGLIIGVMLLAPLGLLETGMSYERMHGLVGSPIGKVLTIAVITLTLWHCAHHIRHFAVDLGVSGQAPAYLSYAFALVGTLAAFGLTLGL
ncbi:MAG: fumarate reductase subunit D [bacterium]|nr:fumarate reductase subunit D [bacterium]